MLQCSKIKYKKTRQISKQSDFTLNNLQLFFMPVVIRNCKKYGTKLKTFQDQFDHNIQFCLLFFLKVISSYFCSTQKSLKIFVSIFG